MITYVIRRLLIAIPILLIISILLFSMIQFVPGDAFTSQIDPRIDPEYHEQMRKKFGLDKGPVEQYFIWAENFIKGEFGISFVYKIPVQDLIGERIMNTFFLAVTSIIITYFLAILLGVYSAQRPYSKLDYTVTGLSFVGLSLPSFFAGLLAIYLFSFMLDLFPAGGTETAGADYTGIRALLDRLHHVILPAFVLSIINIAGYSRYVRAQVLETKKMDYVRTALAKGLSHNLVMRKHVLRNSLLPLITLFGMDIGMIFSGAIITETIFTWPGLGQFLFEAAQNRDYPILMAGTMMIGVFTILGSIIADILYSVVDPRVRYD